MQLIPAELLLFGQLFGALPLKYFKNSKLKSSLEYSPKLQFWALIFISALTGLSFYSLYSEFSDRSAAQITQNYAIATVLDIVPLNLMAVVIAISASRQYPKFLEMCHIVERFDNTLRLKAYPRKRTRQKVLIVFFYTTVVLVLTLAKRSQKTPRYWAYFVYRMTYYVQAALYLHFSFVCNTLATRFTVINTKFREEIMRPSLQEMNINLCLPYIDTTSDSSRVLSSLTASTQQIKVLISSYSELCEAVQQANQFYSSQLLAAVFSAFVHNIATLYFFIHMLLTPDPELSLSLKLVQGVWVFTHSTCLVLLVLPASALSNAAEETAPNICQLINKNFNNSATKDQLKTFLMQLHHYEVGFSALGFFKINNQVLTSIIGSVATFLAILIQFQSTDPEHPATSTISSN